MPLSALALIEPVLTPPAWEKTTVAPPAVRLFPDASFACKRSLTTAPDAMVSAPTVSTEVTGDAAPAVTVIVGSVEVTAPAPIVACTVVLVPAATAVKIAVYVPLAWSVVGPTLPPLVPPVTVNATVDPPAVNALPAASRACSVSVAVPPEPIVSLDTVMTDVAAEITPGVTATVGGVEATGAELIVAPTVVAVPARTPVNVAV